MNVRRLCLALVVVVVGCNRSAEEPFLTPPPPLVAPLAAQPAPAANNNAPQPTPPQPTPPQPQPGRGQQPGADAQQIRASHVLVMYRGSMRAPPTVTRTQQEARARAEQVLARARRGDDFAALAREYSDEPGAGDRGGDLGRFGHGSMVPPFEQAAFALRVGQVSEIVETPFGYHVIKRTE